MISRDNTQNQRSQWAQIIFLVLLASFLRIYNIGIKNIWLDEAISLWISNHPINELFSIITHYDQHPPLYYSILHFWMVIGEAEANLRFLSALFGILTVPILYNIGKTIGGHRVGTLAAFFLAISPLHIQYSQEVRMYALLTLTCSIGMWGVARIIKNEGMQGRIFGPSILAGYRKRRIAEIVPTTQKWNDLPWIAYICGSVCAVYTHNTGLFFIIAANIIFVWRIFHNRKRIGDISSSLMLSNIIVLAIWCLWIPSVTHQARLVAQEFWIPFPDVKTIIRTIENINTPFLGNASVIARVLLQSFILILTASGLWLLRKRKRWIIFLLSFWLTAPIGELIVSLWKSIFLGRTLVWITLPLFILLGYAIVQIRNSVIRCGCVVALSTFSVIGITQYQYAFVKENWSDVVAYITDNAKEDDLILFHSPTVRLPFEYYSRRQNVQLEMKGVPVELFERGWEPKMRTDDVPYLENLARFRSRIWLVYSHNWYSDEKMIIPATLDRIYERVALKEFTDIRLFLYSNKHEKISQVAPD